MKQKVTVTPIAHIVLYLSIMVVMAGCNEEKPGITGEVSLFPENGARDVNPDTHL